MGIIGGRAIAIRAADQSRVQFWAKKDTTVLKIGVLNGVRVVLCLFFAVLGHDGLPKRYFWHGIAAPITDNKYKKTKKLHYGCMFAKKPLYLRSIWAGSVAQLDRATAF